MSDRKLGESHFAKINSEKENEMRDQCEQIWGKPKSISKVSGLPKERRKSYPESQDLQQEGKIHLQDIGTCRPAGAQGGEVPEQLVGEDSRFPCCAFHICNFEFVMKLTNETDIYK